MTDKGWDTVFGLGVTIGVVAVVCFIASLFYFSSMQTHAETMAKIEACSAEYAYNQTENVHFVLVEYCAGSIADRIISVKQTQFVKEETTRESK